MYVCTYVCMYACMYHPCCRYIIYFYPCYDVAELITFCSVALFLKTNQYFTNKKYIQTKKKKKKKKKKPEKERKKEKKSKKKKATNPSRIKYCRCIYPRQIYLGSVTDLNLLPFRTEELINQSHDLSVPEVVLPIGRNCGTMT